MSYSVPAPLRPRRAITVALLATTTMAAFCGGCSVTDRLGSRSLPAPESQMSAAEAATATSQWAAAYAKKPQDPKMALGYAQTLKAIGSKDRALEVLTTAYQANPANGEVAAELGRLALDVGRLDIAKATLKTAEAQGVRDWKTLSAQGTLYAKQGKHTEAQQYFLAALQEKPDSVSVINNLALSYALDGKANKSEDLLRKAVASGHEDKRVRQNLALVLGLQGKFEEARQVASADLPEAQAKTNVSYLRNMLASPTRMASLKSDGSDEAPSEDWQPFADNAASKVAAPVGSVAAATPKPSRVQVVAATEEIKAPPVPKPAKTAAASQAKPAATTQAAKVSPAPGAPMPITPQAGTTDKPKTAQASAAGGTSLFKAPID